MEIGFGRAGPDLSKLLQLILPVAMLALTLLPGRSDAIPALNRQTGQNCVARPAGGQLPEVMPYGRMFKLTGYTIGERAIPVAATYVYQARYGGSLGLFNLTGSSNTAYLMPGYDPGSTPPSLGQPNGNRSGSPATRGLTMEPLWTPIQYLPLGVQYTGYERFNGASKNYDGFGRNASDNNSLFCYT